MSLPRYRRAALRQLGASSARVRPVRRVEYAAVTARAKGRCELCGRPQDPLDPHHAFTRGHLPGIPAAFCETRDLIVGLCRACHDAIHQGGVEGEEDEARYLALARFCARWNLHLEDLVAEAGPDPVDVMRAAVRRLEAGAA